MNVSISFYIKLKINITYSLGHYLGIIQNGHIYPIKIQIETHN
jgi:hypothetical protein